MRNCAIYILVSVFTVMLASAQEVPLAGRTERKKELLAGENRHLIGKGFIPADEARTPRFPPHGSLKNYDRKVEIAKNRMKNAGDSASEGGKGTEAPAGQRTATQREAFKEHRDLLREELKSGTLHERERRFDEVKVRTKEMVERIKGRDGEGIERPIRKRE